MIFLDFPSFLIVVGGTLGAVMIQYPLSAVLSTVSVVKNAFFGRDPDPSKRAEDITKFAELAKRESLVALEKAKTEDPFLQKGLTLCADGHNADTIRHILSLDMTARLQRHKRGQRIFRSIGSMGPAFGMIGTLVGLVQLLSNMQDPSGVGPAMALALITTLYGALLANLIAIPLAEKLANRSEEEALMMELSINGVAAISQGAAPQLVREQLVAYLSQSMQAKLGKR
ncbi:MAG: MotA/TolQ/ExbB proton channel family protein [Candidatus Schekmanbacteria bacterium]|nr:MotA/TolQ/ExbB proton channel family protein [Candidatus Schekmanbacteria bacterium]